MRRLALFLTLTMVAIPHGDLEAIRDGWESLVGVRVEVGEPGRVTRLAADVRWSPGATITLRGPVEVAAGGVLRIDPGTKIEADVGAYIVVTRDGTIDAAGTLNEPIELTCSTVPRFTGCWGGVIIQGNARVNHGTADSPAGPRGGPGGCLQAIDPFLPFDPYGGCVDADSSGVLRFVRIEYAERGLQLQGVGSGTRIESVQANRGRFEGVLVTGGDVNLRNIFLTANGTGLRWTGGWRGIAQRIAIQQDIASHRAALVGQNAAQPNGDPEAMPRSAPQVFNLTILAQSVAANPFHSTARALVLERGTAGAIRNAFLYAPRIGLDITGVETCGQLVAGSLSLRNVVTAGATTLGEGLVSPSCLQSEAEILGAAASMNSVLPSAAGLLVSQNDLLLPDLRPVAGSALATAVAEVPPSGGFLDGPPYVGAVPPMTLLMQIPWFSGWTTPAPEPAPIPSGTIAGVVRSPFRGPLAGVVVRESETGTTAVTSGIGAYSLALPAGTVFLEVISVPADCTMPPPRAGIVFPLTASVLDLSVDCSPPPGTSRISAGDGFMCGVSDRGTHCWGHNGNGQLGNGTTTSSTVPVATVSDAFTSVSAGERHACGLRPTGMVKCWGDGANGRIGDGQSIDQTAPVEVSGGHVFRVVSVGDSHACAVTIAGALYCWGENTFGQLGDGTTSDAAAPVLVAAAMPFATVSAGARHTCALDLVGAAYCWGDGTSGQLGDGTLATRTTPVPVATAERFGMLSAEGDAHNCAMAGSGALRCWGANEAGQLGDGSTTMRAVPTPVASSLTFTAIAIGGAHSCAVSAGTTGLCWGANGSGQLGNGTQSPTSTPIALSGAPLVKVLTAGPDYSCGITFGAVTGAGGNEIVISLRALICWGNNANGQFGHGDTMSSLAPVAAASGLLFP